MHPVHLLCALISLAAAQDGTIDLVLRSTRRVTTRPLRPFPTGSSGPLRRAHSGGPAGPVGFSGPMSPRSMRLAQPLGAQRRGNRIPPPTVEVRPSFHWVLITLTPPELRATLLRYTMRLTKRRPGDARGVADVADEDSSRLDSQADPIPPVCCIYLAHLVRLSRHLIF